MEDGGSAYRVYRQTTTTAQGGAGGRGQGYNQSNTAGLAGGANAGTGGWGNEYGQNGLAGNSGNAVGGSAGGLAGNAVIGNARVTWIAVGTVLGPLV